MASDPAYTPTSACVSMGYGGDVPSTGESCQLFRHSDDRQSILSLLEHLSIELSPGIETTFVLDWNIVSFLEQQYDTGLEHDMRDIITWTEQYGNIEVSTCGQYTNKHWPKLGPEVLSALGSAAATRFTEQTTCQIEKGSLTFRLVKDHLQVTIDAPESIIVETAHLLCWLGAVCRAPTTDFRSYCTPILHKIAMESKAQMYTISYLQHPPDDVEGAEVPSPKSWHCMCRNPCIARGFSIPSRDQQHTGVELEYGMMRNLGRITSDNDYQGQFVLKGVKTMLVPIKSTVSSLTWHFYVAPDRQRVSWNKAFDERVWPERLPMLNTHMEDLRHFVD